MATETEYVPVEDRVRVVELPQDMHGIDVFVNSDETWSRVGCGHSKRATESAAEDLVATFKDACEAVRARCVEAALSAGTAGGYPGENAKRYHAQDIAFIIRGLEL